MIKEVVSMATKAMNFKMDEADIEEMKDVAAVYNMTVTDLIKNAIKDYISELKRDPFYRLTNNVKDASAKETAEVLAAVEGMSDDDLSIVSVKKFKV